MKRRQFRCVWSALFLGTALAAPTAGEKPTDVHNSERGAPISAAEALAGIEVPEGFHVSLFASEPDVQQPIALTTDERGRLWVAENYTYAEQAVNFDTAQNDRIVILEDADHDGRAEKRTVFWDQGKKLSSVEMGQGGVWALCAPHLLFIPDRDRNDIPDGPPEIVLDGWDESAVRHNIVNGLKWGPDGWLYGRHGILATSLVGRPGDAPSQRQKINCGVWRYHPTRKLFEIVAHGTTNPWGFDYDDCGEMFFINTVIGHLWHLIPGAHYERMFGADFNPHLYGLIGQTADHVHWDTGELWNEVRTTLSDTTLQAGGGHAHSGLMIYLGDNWPNKYRNSMFTLNFHGRRLNNDRLEREGAGYVGRHGDDLFFVKDEWFRGIDLISGADGSAFIADWSDTGECHEEDGVHRSSGRIYKLSYGSPRPPAPADLAKLSDLELVELQLHKNDWYVRQSRRLLQERAATKNGMTAAREALRQLFAEQTDETRQLRAMWALEVIDAVDEAWLRQQLVHSGEHVRVWALRLLADRTLFGEETVARLAKMAGGESSALVRLYLAAAMQRMPVEDRWDVAAGLAARLDDADDRQLPLMIWYGIEEAVAKNVDRAVALCGEPIIPLVRRNLVRRVTNDLETNRSAVNQLVELAGEHDAAFQLDVLQGMGEALAGWRQAPTPASWSKVAAVFSASPAEAVQQQARELGMVFGDGRAIAELRQLAADAAAQPESRRSALRALVDERAPETLMLLKELLSDFAVSNECVRGFAAFDDDAIPELILGRFGYLDPTGKALAVDSLTSRPAYARALLAAVDAGTLESDVISASHARQLQEFDDDAIAADLERLWGSVRATAEDKRKQIEQLHVQLTPERLATGDVSQGRALFDKTCSSCHILYGQGKLVGPDLTGSNRHNLSYLLENIVDPSASVGKEFRTTAILTDDGRAVSGVVVAKTDRAITLQTQTEQLVLSLDEIEEMVEQELSLMPDGLLAQLSDVQICDLFAYLSTHSQAPLPAEQ